MTKSLVKGWTKGNKPQLGLLFTPAVTVDTGFDLWSGT